MLTAVKKNEDQQVPVRFRSMQKPPPLCQEQVQGMDGSKTHELW